MSNRNNNRNLQESGSNRGGMPAGIVPKAGELPNESEKDKQIRELRKLNQSQLEELSESKKRPIQVKRKTLSDYMRRDTTAVHMLQVAKASYDAELNRYNVDFQQGTMA